MKDGYPWWPPAFLKLKDPSIWRIESARETWGCLRRFTSFEYTALGISSIHDTHKFEYTVTVKLTSSSCPS